MGSSAPLPTLKEISGIAAFISIPQLIASPIIAGLTHVIRKDSMTFDLLEILDFLVISFPLTLSITVLTVLIMRGQFNLFSLVIAVAGAALLSNLLHGLISQFPSVELKKTISESFNYSQNKYGNSAVIRWIGKIFSVYWKLFGPLLFIQSCCIGIYAGYRYHSIQEAKKIKPGS